MARGAGRLALRGIRRALRELDQRLDPPRLPPAAPPADQRRATHFRNLLHQLDGAPGSAEYLATHVGRLARTLELTPPAPPGGRALELGCYMQMTPLLASELGYQAVRGAYFGPAGRSETRVATVDGKEIFGCEVDLFDAEQDPYPYPAGSFELVLACEILEHFEVDPMHCFFECHRVLAPHGRLLVTTPNSASVASIARALQGESPGVFSQYADPRRAEKRAVHVREYTPGELNRALEAAGFVVEWIFTERFEGPAVDTWVLDVIEGAGFSSELRGEQIYCLARRSDQPIDRYPSWLYT